MIRHANETFTDQHVVLDDGVFIGCTFDGCSLEYSGGECFVQDCKGEGIQLVWKDAALRTLALVQALGMQPPKAAIGPGTP
jgi:hypothetical protein